MVCLNHQARLQCIKWHDINLSTHYVRSLKLAINTLKGFDHKSILQFKMFYGLTIYKQ